MDKQNPTKVVTAKARLSYANVWEPQSINGSELKYSVSIIIPKSDRVTVSKVNAAIDAAIQAGLGKFGGKMPNRATLKLPLRDGDTERTDEAYHDAYFLNANSRTAPQIVDRDLNRILDSQYKAGFADLMAHDCSGFLSWLMRETGIWDDRKNCDGLWALCDTVARNEFIAGDFLFRNSTTNAEDETHVGLYLGRGMVIHAKGRDVGVVVEGINQGGSGYWHKCGRCKLLY